MRITFLAAALAAVASFGAHAQTAPATAAAPIVIKFSHVVAIDTPKGQAAERFKARAEKLTKGRVRIEVYPNSSLYKDKEELDALQDGKVQMLAPSLAKFSGLGLPEFEAFDLPYLFPNKAALYHVLDGKIGKDLLKKLEPQGIVGLAYWDNGFKDMSANKPLLTPADFKGLKVRIQSSEVLAEQMRTLGAAPQVMGFADTFAALKAHTLDGTENPPANMYTQKMNQVQTNMTITHHGYLGYAVIVNKKFWDGLPADIRSSLTNAMAEVTAYEKSYAQFDNDRALQAIRQTGKTEVYVLSGAEQEQWRRALAPVQKKMEARIGKELIEAINKDVATGK